MNYDPQRSHRRPRPPEAGPSPVDALLEGADAEADDGAAPSDNTRPDPSGVPATPHADRVSDTTDIAPRPLPEFVTPDPQRGSLRTVAVVAVVALAVAVLVWLRRRTRDS